MAPSIIIGLLGVAVLAVSAWLDINRRDGSGWAFVALCLIVTSCSQATP